MEIKDLPTVSDLPYPEIQINQPNKYWVGLLQNTYAGCCSETSAILKYIFQNYIFEKEENQIATIFKKIAIVEMHHHKYLANAITLLGGIPFYADSQGQPFNISRCVPSTTNLKKALLNNIEQEEQTILNYNFIKTKIDNESVVALIDRIIIDEEIHKKTLETILEYISFYN